MVDIAELSAKELYELARKKELKEARQAQMQEQLTELKARREQLIDKHQEALADTERQIEELDNQRKELLEVHERALTSLDEELARLEAEMSTQKATPATTEKPEPTPAGPTASTPSSDDTTAAVETIRSAPTAGTEPLLPEQEELPPPIGEDVDEHREGKKKGKDESEQLELLMEHLQKMMKGRSYISEGLMKEKLNFANFKTANLGKLLDILVRQSRLVRRSGGNYVLGRAAKKR
ncbi:MAG: hypothetical protein OQK54_07270 [Gammaproteobacteria bacterium]|nr:hypothetical protein [Gammaproteobacteria bacterium]